MKFKFWEKPSDKYVKAKPGAEQEKSVNRQFYYLSALMYGIGFPLVFLYQFLIDTFSRILNNVLFGSIATLGLYLIIALFLYLFYVQEKTKAVQMLNIGDKTDNMVALRDGGYFKFFANYGKVTLVQELEQYITDKETRKSLKGIRLYLINALRRKGKPYQDFLVISPCPFQQHLKQDMDLTVYHSIVSVDLKVSPISYKEVGLGKNDIPIVRVTDSAVSREDIDMVKANPSMVAEVTKQHDIWEATHWKEQYNLKCRELETANKTIKGYEDSDQLRRIKLKEDSKIKRDTEPQRSKKMVYLGYGLFIALGIIVGVVATSWFWIARFFI